MSRLGERPPHARPHRMGRREAVATLLGAPLAAAACDYLPTRSFDGALRGGAHQVGHRLRGATIEGAPGPVRRVGVAIVGAGPAGLSAAWRLERLGYRDFVVLDLEPQPGGTSAYGTDGVVPYPWGAHYVPVPADENPGLERLLGEVGALARPTAGEGPVEGREGVVVRAPEERLFVDGRWYEGLYPGVRAGPSDVAELRRFEAEMRRLGRLVDGRGRRAFTIPIAKGSDDADLTQLDTKSAAAYLADEGYRSPLLGWYADYACRDDYGLSLDQTSAWALVFYFASRLSPEGERDAPLLTWPEGNGRLVRHMAGVAGRRVELGRLVTDVRVRDDGVDLAVYDARTGGMSRVAAEHAILAVPRFVAARIVRDRELPGGSQDFSYGSWVVANLHLRARPRSEGFAFAWDNVLFDSPSLGYVVATHQTLRDLGPTIWTYYQPLTDAEPGAARQKLLELSHGDFCDAIMTDLGRAHGDLERHVERIDVWRWGHAMVRPVPGFLWGAARRAARRPLGRVAFAHSDLSGLALFEESQYHGVMAAETVLRALGRELSPLYGG